MTDQEQYQSQTAAPPDGVVSLAARVEAAANVAFDAAGKTVYVETRDVVEGKADPAQAKQAIARAYAVAIEHSLIAREAILAPFADVGDDQQDAADQPAADPAAPAAMPKAKAKAKPRKRGRK